MKLSQDTTDYAEYEILKKTDIISAKITNIIDEAEEYCFLITPYFNEWIHLERSLEAANKQKKRIVFFFSEKQDLDEYKDRKKKDRITEFYKKYNFDIIYIKNLHAKIYLNEKEAIITSMNLYDSSNRYNYEIGVLIKNKDIVDLIYNDIILNYIYNTGKADELTLKGYYYKLLETNNSIENDNRYCVYCGTSMKQVNDNLYCNHCHESLHDFNQNNFNFCNICGKSTKENKLSLCSSCYKKYKQNND